MKYLLDTCICIELFHNNPLVVNRLKNIDITDCYISDVTVAELMYGAEKSSRREQRMAQVVNFIKKIQVVPFRTAIPLFAIEKVRLESIGMKIEDFDLLIGCTAAANGMVMVTDNVRHMSRISRITIENWIR